MASSEAIEKFKQQENDRIRAFFSNDDGRCFKTCEARCKEGLIRCVSCTSNAPGILAECRDGTACHCARMGPKVGYQNCGNCHGNGIVWNRERLAKACSEWRWMKFDYGTHERNIRRLYHNSVTEQPPRGRGDAEAMLQAWDNRTGKPWQADLEGFVEQYVEPAPDYSDEKNYAALEALLQQAVCDITQCYTHCFPDKKFHAEIDRDKKEGGILHGDADGETKSEALYGAVLDAMNQ